MKSICFLLTKKRASISSIAAADMKLIIVLHCSMLKLANAPSLRLYTHDMHVTWFMKKFDLRSNHKPTAWLHWVIIHYLWGIKKYVILVFCITKIKVRKKIMKFIHVENLHSLSLSQRLILTMPSLEKQPWMRSLHFSFLQL